MSEPDIKSADHADAAPPRSPFETILAAATEAFGSAFVLWILGRVAINIASSFASQMIPSLPPGFESSSPSPEHPSRHLAGSAAFGFFFTIFFIHSLWVGFRGQGVGAPNRIARILSNLRENWFGLIVGNAIGAWVTVTVLSHLPRFSPFQMLWHWFLGWSLPELRAIAISLFGASNTSSVSDWFAWSTANQMKLNFWILYLAGAFDDLGVPNFKALARWSWRRFQKRNTAPLPASIERGNAA